MSRLGFLISCLFFYAVALASDDVVSVGDTLFVQAQVLGCDIDTRTVEYGEVSKAGLATFFNDIELAVAGKTPEQVALLLTDAIEEQSGHRPASISIVRIADEGDEQSVKLLYEIYNLRKRGCRMRPWRDWQQPVIPDGSWQLVSFPRKPAPLRAQ